MALATQCPHCYTSFRVANDQLKLHAGLVRCGSCKRTFNGIEYLLAPGEAPRQAPKESTAVTPIPTTELAKIAPDTTSDIAIDAGISEANANPAPHTQSSATDDADINVNHALSTLTGSAESIHNELENQETVLDAVQVDPKAIPAESELSATNSSDNFIDQLAVETEIANSSPIVNSSDLISPTQETPTPQSGNNEFSSTFATAKDEIDDRAHLDSEIATMPVASDELTHQNNLMQQFSAQLETIAPDLGASPNADKPKKAPALTSGLEFELTNEERELVEQADLLHQLELENRAAILDEDAKEWSKHEPGFDEQSLLAAFAANEELRSEENQLNRKVPVQDENIEASDSTTENETPTSDQSLDDDGANHTPGFVLQAEKKRRYGKLQTFALSITCLFLMLGIAAQSIYFFRSTIASEMPATKPHLLRACQLLKCQISLPAERYMLEVTGSELLILNEDLKINTLAFQIQNKSNTVQEWPVLELTLEDVRGKTVLQKVFLPADYLSNKADVAKGIAARSESNHKLYFEINASKASNYLVKIFYP
ncbi:DUF3426 domain-containing protein [Undibacterium sp. Ji22W]|uniref:DUF3426 domain-containing protein n=1 Tax=Undibacterium sp. Ji22W TaxID=3413038 RepID=UPI003BF032E1